LVASLAARKAAISSSVMRARSLARLEEEDEDMVFEFSARERES
jgi:hypothetical protein